MTTETTKDAGRPAERDEDSVRRFVEHMARCDGCDRYLQQIRSTVTQLGQLPREDDLSGGDTYQRTRATDRMFFVFLNGVKNAVKTLASKANERFLESRDARTEPRAAPP